MPERQEKMVELGQMLRAARKRRGLTQRELADRCGVADSNISMYERGVKPPSARACIELAKALELDVIGLLRTTEGLRKRLSGIVTLLDHSELQVLPDRLTRVPVYDVGAAYDRDWTNGDFPAGESDRFDWVLTEDEDAFGCTLRGDSMEPVFHDGDLLIFEPSAQVCNGDFCLVRTREWATFKQVFFTKTKVRLVPVNRHYMEIMLDRDSDEIVQIQKMTMHVRRY